MINPAGSESKTRVEIDDLMRVAHIPVHWHVRRIKDIGTIQYGLGQPPQYLETGLPFIRATNVTRGKLTVEGLVFVEPEDVPIGRSPFLRENDIIVVRSGANTADSALIPAEYDGAVAGYDMVVRPRRIHPQYLAYALLSSYVLEDQLRLRSFRAAQPHLNKEQLGNAVILCPPLSEQQAIAAYLDAKTAQIDRKIDLLAQKAAKYRQLKQSLISEAVTRGLDRSVPMKDSGVDWMGKIPEHWEVKRLKVLAQIKTGGKDTVDNVEDGKYPFFVRSQTVEKIDSYSFDGEAILTAGDGVGVGKVFHHFLGKFDYHQRVYRISHFKRVQGRYLFYFMRENFHKDALRFNSKATVDSLRLPMFRNFPVPFGGVSEQQVIVDYLDTKTAQIDRIVETIEIQIEKLKELRKALINDVVTGKLRVT